MTLRGNNTELSYKQKWSFYSTVLAEPHWNVVFAFWSMMLFKSTMSRMVGVLLGREGLGM